MTGLSASESDLDLSTDSGDPRALGLSRQSSGVLPRGEAPSPDPTAGDAADLREYGRTLGVDVDRDADLRWLVHEAFVASLPPSWTEYYDEDGRVYFYNQVTKESSWSHPMDKVFKELVELVKAVRAELPPASRARRSEAVQAHLQSVHERAMAALDGWSGPYTSDSLTYFYHAALEVSVWDNPVDEWQSELALRQQVLHRCLLADSAPSPSAGSSDGRFEGGGTGLTEAALRRLPLGLNARNPDDTAPAPVPQSPGSARSARSFISARSTCTARSLTPTRARSREWLRPNPESGPKTPLSGSLAVPRAETSPARRHGGGEAGGLARASSATAFPAAGDAWVPEATNLLRAASASDASPTAAAARGLEVRRCSLSDELAQVEEAAPEAGAAAVPSLPDELEEAAGAAPQADACPPPCLPDELEGTAPAPQADAPLPPGLPDELEGAERSTPEADGSVSMTSGDFTAGGAERAASAAAATAPAPASAHAAAPAAADALAPEAGYPSRAASAGAAVPAAPAARTLEAKRDVAGPREAAQRPQKARSVSPSKRPPLPERPQASSARAAAEDDDSDSLEFTFGRTAPVSLPKFGA